MEDYLKANQANWDDRAVAHVADNGTYYRVEEFLEGASTLQEIETRLVGDVTNKKLLHLMCHIGLDSLSWARKGAKVTGIDLSEASIETARSLATKSGLDARFISCDVNDVSNHVNEQFDVVIAAYGICVWLPVMDAFVKQAVSCLAPGGKFVLVDIHPVLMACEPDAQTGRFTFAGTYFSKDPEIVEVPHSYAARHIPLKNTKTFQWNHSIAEVIGACINNNLTIQSFEEYPFLYQDFFPGHFVQDGRRWRLKTADFDIPMLFSISATLPDQSK